MNFRIHGLPAAPFRHLFGLPDEALRARGAERVIADATPGFPDRIEMRDALPGERLLLLNYTHQPADTPYRASHAIFIREGATDTYDRTCEVPDVLRLRMISLRAFDRSHRMVEADLVPGGELESLIARLFANPETAYLHAHYARRGCYAGRIDRA